MLVRDGKLSGYGACTEIYGWLLIVVQEDIQQCLNIEWANTGAIDVDNIIQEIINLDDSKVGRE